VQRGEETRRSVVQNGSSAGGSALAGMLGELISEFTCVERANGAVSPHSRPVQRPDVESEEVVEGTTQVD
jgi:hypothetical protein